MSYPPTFFHADLDNNGFVDYNEFKIVVNKMNWDLYNIKKNKHQLLYILFLIFSYLVIGMVSFHIGEGWKYLDAFYFCLITVTTIGLGDFYPKHNRMLVFLFSCFGLGLIALLVRFMCEIIIENSRKVHLFKKKNKFQNKILTYDQIINYFHKNKYVKIYRNSHIVWAMQLKDDIKINTKNKILRGKKKEWLLSWNSGNFYILKNSLFNDIYEKIKKRDKNDKKYRLRNKLLCLRKNDFNNDIIVQLKKEDKNTNIVNVKDNEFIVCDIITKSLSVINQDEFLKNYELDTHKRINYENLLKSRQELSKICNDIVI